MSEDRRKHTFGNMENLTIDEIIAEVYNRLENAQKRDIQQDDCTEELKEMVESMQKEVNGLYNGWKDDLIERQSERTGEQIEVLLQTLSALTLKNAETHGNVEEYRENKNKRKSKTISEILAIIGSAVTAGGILYLLAEKFLTR